MYTCSWCKKSVAKVNKYNKFGSEFSLCDKCYDSLNKSECRKCHSKISVDASINGLCNSCFVEEQVDSLREQEEVLLSLGGDIEEHNCNELTDDDIEAWLTMKTSDDAFGPADLLKYKELKRLWIVVKLNAVGIYDDNKINKYMEPIEELVSYNLNNLLYKKCRIVLCETKDDRRLIKQSRIICSKDNIFIIENL